MCKLRRKANICLRVKKTGQNHNSNFNLITPRPSLEMSTVEGVYETSKQLHSVFLSSPRLLVHAERLYVFVVYEKDNRMSVV